MADDPEFDAYAALLRRGRDVPTMLEDLAGRLQRALPDRIELKRSGVLRGRKLAGLTVGLGEDRLRIEIDHRRVVAWIDHIVRGVCIRSEETTVDAWLSRLGADLSREARRSTETRLAIEEALR